MLRVRMLAVTLLVSTSLFAGPIFLTGHDPDFHEQSGNGTVLLQTAINFVDHGSALPFVYIESNIPTPGGHLIGTQGVEGAGYVLGTDFVHLDASQMDAAFWANLATTYSAIVVASDFGALLTQDELDNLNAHASDIAAFVNGGGGLAAFAETDPPNGLASSGFFGFVPVTVTTVFNDPPYTVTPYGFTTFGLTAADVNDPSHNAFGGSFGLNIVDLDALGHPMTLAGDTTIGSTGFGDVPEPATMVLLGTGLLGLVRKLRR